MPVTFSHDRSGDNSESQRRTGTASEDEDEAEDDEGFRDPGRPKMAGFTPVRALVHGPNLSCRRALRSCTVNGDT